MKKSYQNKTKIGKNTAKTFLLLFYTLLHKFPVAYLPVLNNKTLNLRYWLNRLKNSSNIIAQ